MGAIFIIEQIDDGFILTTVETPVGTTSVDALVNSIAGKTATKTLAAEDTTSLSTKFAAELARVP